MHPLEEAMLSCDMDGEGSDSGHRFIPLGPSLSVSGHFSPFLGPPGIKPSGPGLHCHCAQVSILRSALWGPAVCCSLLPT